MNPDFDFVGSEDKPALIAFSTPEWLHEAKTALEELGYKVQAVDVSAYLLYQHVAPSSYIRKKSGQNYFQRLDPIVCKVVAARPPDGVVRL